MSRKQTKKLLIKSKLPWASIVGQMNPVFLESWTGVVRQNVGAAIRLTEGGRKTGHYARVVSFVPERGLAVHWRHNVYLKIVYNKDQNKMSATRSRLQNDS